MKKFTQLPLTLYRIQPKMPVNLRNYADQMAKNRTSFDLKVVNGMVLPTKDKVFTTPNGMSLRPASDTMLNILENFRGEPNIYTMVTGLKLPPGLCVYHEHTDHYSLQTTEPISLPDLNKKMTEFLRTLPSMTKQQFIDQMNDVEDQDC